MHDDDTQPQGLTPAEHDQRVEGLVLTQALVLHPAQLTILELARQLGVDPEDFGENDAVERAVRELTNVGLLHCTGRLVTPTLAALRADALIGGHI